MNKTELIAAIAAKTGLSKKDADKALAATIETIADTMAAGNKVQLVGFGSFETKTRAAHEGRNPLTKEVMMFPAKTVPVFKAGKALKDKVAK
ncbi:MAG: HU family DNA-binding protein [Oscillospiraceae bacterium]|nr:HU family DNA-binding protein [Oscillospiraceae bacterium]